MSTEEVLLRATQCWLMPELVDGDRVVFEVLGFTAADEGEKLVNMLIWTRPGSAPLTVGDVLRPGKSSMSDLHRGTVTGLTKEVAMFGGEVLDLVQLVAESNRKLSRKVVSIANKRISMERPASGASAGINALATLLQGASKAYTDDT